MRGALGGDYCRDKESPVAHFGAFSPMGKARLVGGCGGHGAYHQRDVLADVPVQGEDHADYRWRYR